MLNYFLSFSPGPKPSLLSLRPSPQRPPLFLSPSFPRRADLSSLHLSPIRPSPLSSGPTRPAWFIFRPSPRPAFLLFPSAPGQAFPAHPPARLASLPPHFLGPTSTAPAQLISFGPAPSGPSASQPAPRLAPCRRHAGPTPSSSSGRCPCRPVGSAVTATPPPPPPCAAPTSPHRLSFPIKSAAPLSSFLSAHSSSRRPLTLPSLSRISGELGFRRTRTPSIPASSCPAVPSVSLAALLSLFCPLSFPLFPCAHELPSSTVAISAALAAVSSTYPSPASRDTLNELPVLPSLSRTSSRRPWPTEAPHRRLRRATAFTLAVGHRIAPQSISSVRFKTDALDPPGSP